MTDSANLPENQKIVLLEYPEGVPTAACMGVETEPTRAPDAGEVVIKNDSVSIDAWIATTMSKGWLHEFMPLGGTVAALGVGHVIASNFDGLAVGDAVTGPVGAQTYTTLGGEAFQKVDESIAPLSAYLGLLSMTTGLTAYFGILDVGDVKEGETVVVSAAAGAVGTVVGQIAKIKGARVIGIAGGPAKCKFLTEKVGFDEAIDYKGESIDERLKALAPDGIDVFFDNVGGEMLDEVLEHIRERARVVICGAISQYDDNNNIHGPKKYLRKSVV